jgi:hypothetical protein
MELQRRKELRDSKIDKVLDNGSNL